MNIEPYIQQLPNFVGLLIAISIQWNALKAKQAMIDRLLDVIIKGENCPEEGAKT